MAPCTTSSSSSVSSSSYSVVSHKTHVPSLQEVAKIFNESLRDIYNEVTVEVVDCPDLTKEPFNLAAQGLCGSPGIADVGGVPYLVPVARTEKAPYSLAQITKDIKYDRALYIGASAGPFQVVGTNSELMPNCLISRDAKHGEQEVPAAAAAAAAAVTSSSSASSSNESVSINSGTHCTKLSDSHSQGYTTFKLDSECDQFCLLGNLFVSNGLPGKVLKVKVKGRCKPEANNFISNLRHLLSLKYNESNGQQVSLGGLFLIKSGKVKVHVMPDFSKDPLCSDEAVNCWLKYFQVKAPLVALTVFHSYDAGQDLRIEHTHCFSSHGDGGHYHYDTTPEDIEYEGYFNIAETIYRIDAPKETHNIGRD